MHNQHTGNESQLHRQEFIKQEPMTKGKNCTLQMLLAEFPDQGTSSQLSSVYVSWWHLTLLHLYQGLVLNSSTEGSMSC